MIKEKWKQYAEFWSMPEIERKARIAQVATSDVIYKDPSVSISGIDAFSDHIGQFQKNIPGSRFVITEAFEHHESSLAHWDMVGSNGSLMMKGTSFANHSNDGKFSSFTGFFAAG